MTAVTIVRENTEPGDEPRFRAIAGNSSNGDYVGKTAGEALDALTKQLGGPDDSSIIVVQQMRPDHFFTSEQINRLQSLISRSKTSALTPDEQAELGALISEELQASALRVSAVADELGR